MKFNLMDVYENLQYMKPTNINFVEIKELIKIIKLSGKRKRKGYDGKQIGKNKIEFYVNNDKVIIYNNFNSLFENNNIKLSKDETLDIHNFIGFIAENSFKYKKLKFNLIDVYKNLQYMK